MKGMRLWLLFSWAAALYVGVMLFLSGVPALDGHAVGGERPLVRQGPPLPEMHGVLLGVGVGVADAHIPPEGLVGVNQRLDMEAGSGHLRRAVRRRSRALQAGKQDRRRDGVPPEPDG